MKDEFRNIKFKLIAVLIMTLILTIGCVFALISKNIQTAYADNDDLYDAINNEFDLDVLQELCSKLTGLPSGRIKANDMKSFVTQSGEDKFGSTVAAVGNNIEVNIGGQTWLALSLVISDSGDVGLTLLTKNSIGNLVFERNYDPAPYLPSGDTPCVMYSTSTLRKDTIMGMSPISENFIIKPTNIAYQRYQKGSPIRANEALDVPENAGITTGCVFLDTYKFHEKAMYRDWGNDNVWLPSYTEAYEIWNKASAFTAGSRSRSTAGSDRAATQRIGSAARGDVDTASPTHLAFHLNLTEALNSGKMIYNPEDLVTEYNGREQTVFSIISGMTEKPEWYDEFDYIGDDAVATFVSSGVVIKNAGDYWIKAEITAEDYIFRDEADKSDSSHLEGETVRWFKVIVKPKELTVNAPEYKTSTGVFTAPTFAVSSELYSDAPTLATKFTGATGDGTVIDQINTFPTKRGSYTAQAILVKSSMDTSVYDGGNYVIKDAATKTCQIVIGYKKLTILTTLTASQNYTGSDIKFMLSGYNTAWDDIADLDLPTGVTIAGDDLNGWSFVVKNAGEYTITAKIKTDKNNDWCWAGDSGTEVTGDQTFKITVTRKTLFVDFTSSNGAFVLQKNSAVTFGVEPSNAVDGDDVLVSLQYYNITAPQSPILVPGGKLNAAALEQGTYRLEAVLDDDLATDNCNYVLDTSSNTQDFTVSSQGINIPTIEWQYRENGGAATAISGSGESATNPFVVTYTGKTFVFFISVNAATLANSGVKIDATYGINGYTNSSQVNATDNAVAITVRFIPYSAEYAFMDQNGQQADDQFEIFTLYVKVDKATIDFTKIEWSADELEFTGLYQTVTVKSGLPSFITPVYSGNTQSALGDYTAEISRLNVTDNDAAKNYIVPTKTSTIPTHAWKIVKKKVIVSWIDSETSTGDGHNVIFLPTFSDNSTGAVVYSYYPAQEGDSSKPDLDKPLSIDDITGSYDATKTTKYFACAKIRDGSGGTGGVNIFDSSNCTLVLDGQEVAEVFQSFEIGDNKNPIRVSLKTDKTVYNGKAQPAEVEIEGAGFNKENLVVTYKVKDEDGNFVAMDDPTNPEPTYAGEYKVCVAVGTHVADTFAISGQKEFDYVIEKADIDLTGMKWLDTDNGNAEYAAPYTYKPGVTHKLEYIGNALDNFDGLKMEFTSESKTNAGKYTVTVTFTVEDADVFNENYNVPETIEFEWEIEKYNPDLSGVKWNYNDKPFTFTVKNSEPVKQSARLIGFPADYADELASLILYGNDTGEYSDIGKHTTSYSIKEDDELRGNYGDLMFPAGLETEINWEIHPLLVDKAETKQTKPFKVGGYTFEEIANMPEDFAEYFDVQVTDVDGEAVEQTDGTWVFENVGRYRIKISFKDGMNKSRGGKYDNVKWSDNSRNALQITLNIEKLVFEVDGWIDNEDGAHPELKVADEDVVPEIEKYFDYVIKEQQTGDIVPTGSRLETDTYYSIVLKLKEEFSGNVGIKYNGTVIDETTPFLFKTPSDELPDDFVEIPEEEKLTIRYPYTGEEIEFKLGDWFDSSIMVVVGEMNGTEIGEYPVIVGFKKGAFTAWGTEEEYVSTIIVTFIIYEDSNKGRFVLTDEAAASHPYKFQYEGYATYDKDISEYVYSETDVLYMTRLAFNDTLEDLLAQFKNGAEIKVFDAKDVAITDMKKVLATGMVLRLMDGTTVLNQLTISVLGDIDGDGKIGTVDKAQLNAFTLGTRKLEAAKLLAGDIDGDGKIGTVDKAQLNAYTLGTRDLYSKLTLRPSNAKSVSVQVEDVEESATKVPEVRTATVAETAEISEEVKVKSEEKRRDSKEETPAVVVVDTKRLRMSF